METRTMGRVTVRATLENAYDLRDAERGLVAADQVRHVEVDDALVDTGATTLSAPKRLIEQLGLTPLRARPVRTTGGPRVVQVYGAVRLTIQGRDCLVDVMEAPDDCPVLIGQVPLELLDFVVDPRMQRLVGNPQHGGEQMYEMY
jgi:predicted aspartyl protease